MSSATLLKKFQDEVDMIPVEGASHIHVIRPNYLAERAPGEPDIEISDVVWDKFEADINEAFERVP